MSHGLSILLGADDAAVEDYLAVVDEPELRMVVVQGTRLIVEARVGVRPDIAALAREATDLISQDEDAPPLVLVESVLRTLFGDLSAVRDLAPERVTEVATWVTEREFMRVADSASLRNAVQERLKELKG